MLAAAAARGIDLSTPFFKDSNILEFLMASHPFKMQVDTEFTKEQDWNTQNYQYHQHANDKGSYSLACITGPENENCPV